MTTNWQPNGAWAGERVAVLLSGPSMSEPVAQELGDLCDRVIAVKYTHRIAPWADMLVALDGNWPQEFRDFAGLKVTGVADAELDALYVGHVQEQVGAVSIRNSGLAAVRIAAGMGASRIVIAGFEPETGNRWHDDAQRPYTGVRAGMEQIRAELMARGVEVEFHEAGSVNPDDAAVLRPGGVVRFMPTGLPTVTVTTTGLPEELVAGKTYYVDNRDD